jgi:hypothetical protein
MCICLDLPIGFKYVSLMPEVCDGLNSLMMLLQLQLSQINVGCGLEKNLY